MFILLKSVPAEKGVFRNYFSSRKINNSPLETHRSSGGLPFYIAEISPTKQGINWDTLRKKCARRASRIVAPRDTDIPDSCGFVRYIPKNFNSILLFNSALNLLSEAEADPHQLCITVTDKNGFLANRLVSLPEFASVIRVITSAPEKYAAACCDIYERFGAVPVIRSVYEPIKSKELVIACDGRVSPLMNTCAIASFKKPANGKLKIIHSGINLTEAHRNLLPPNTMAVDFAGALTELCVCNDYLNSSFSSAEIIATNSTYASPSEAFSAYTSE